MTRNAVRIDQDGTTSVLDLDAEGTTPLAVLQEAVKGYIEAIDLGPILTMYCNEEYLYQPDFTPNARARDLVVQAYGTDNIVTIMGPVIIVGQPDEDGETTGLTDEWVALLTR